MSSTRSQAILYMSSLFIAGIPFSSLGSLIPYMASQLDISSTQYSSMFIWITLAIFAAGGIFKILLKYRTWSEYYKIQIICLLGMAIFGVVFMFVSSKNAQMIMATIIKLFSCVLILVTNILLLNVYSFQDVAKWMSYAHGAYGLGAMVGPIFVAFMGENVFYVVTGTCLLLIPFFFLLRVGQLETTGKQYGFFLDSEERYSKLELLICIGIFAVMGIQGTITSWIPTYTVSTQIEINKGAGQFSSIFWVFEAGSRFAFSFFHGKDSAKLNLSCWSQLAAGLICVWIAVLHYPLVSAYLSAILYGLTLSMIWPLFLSISYDYGILLDIDSIANILISYTLSQGIYSFLTGSLMKIHVQMFHYATLAYSIIVLVVYYLVRNLWVIEYENVEEERREGVGLTFRERPIGLDDSLKDYQL